MRTPSGKLIVELAEDEIAFLNALNAILPAVPDFGRAARTAVAEAMQIIPFDAFAVLRPAGGGARLTVFAVGSLSAGAVEAIRAAMRHARRPDAAVVPLGPDAVEVVELPGDARARDATTWGSAQLHLVPDAPDCCCGMFAVPPDAFERKHAILLSVLTSWLRAYLGFSDAYRQMEEMSFTDPLTGCYNRRKFTDEAEREVERARRYGHALCLGFVDVDRLKQINDGLGHAAGDAVLRTLGEVFVQQLRKVDVFARYGGDEFVALLPHTPADGALPALSRVLRACRERMRERLPQGIEFSASAGLAAYAQGDTVETLVRRADGALYVAKRDRPGTVVVAA